MTTPAHDPETLAFYAREAEAYATRKRSALRPRLRAFMERLPHGARVLELGCGAGDDAAQMLNAGFEVVPTDGSARLAAVAEAKLGRPVRVMLFDQLDEVATYDAVWANASLLHVPADTLPAVLARVQRALRPVGLFYASYKAGAGGGRDRLGRYYNFPSVEQLRASYASAGAWRELEIVSSLGAGYDGLERTFLHVTALRD